MELKRIGFDKHEERFQTGVNDGCFVFEVELGPEEEIEHAEFSDGSGVDWHFVFQAAIEGMHHALYFENAEPLSNSPDYLAECSVLKLASSQKTTVFEIKHDGPFGTLVWSMRYE